MTEHPIIFQDWGIRAILAGTKTQTRRIVRPQPPEGFNYIPDLILRDDRPFSWSNLTPEQAERQRHCAGTWWTAKCPYGDNLWVREAWRQLWLREEWSIQYRADDRILSLQELSNMHKIDLDDLRMKFICIRPRRCDEKYITDEVTETEAWRPSIHMPRWASRIDLTGKSRRAERVQDISNADARAEGLQDYYGPNAPYMLNEVRFRDCWDSINVKPRARTRGGDIMFYESFPWDGEFETREYHGKPHYVYPNPFVWRIEWPPYEGLAKGAG